MQGLVESGLAAARPFERSVHSPLRSSAACAWIFRLSLFPRERATLLHARATASDDCSDAGHISNPLNVLDITVNLDWTRCADRGGYLSFLSKRSTIEGTGCSSSSGYLFVLGFCAIACWRNSRMIFRCITYCASAAVPSSLLLTFIRSLRRPWQAEWSARRGRLTWQS